MWELIKQIQFQYLVTSVLPAFPGVPSELVQNVAPFPLLLGRERAPRGSQALEEPEFARTELVLRFQHLRA